MWLKLACSAAVIQLVLGASLIPCPDRCLCQHENDEFAATCENFNFLNKLVPKQYASIAKLKINGTSGTVSPKLKYLKNLNSLDLSNSNVMLSNLPNMPKLKTLDLSRNHLKDVRLSFLPQNLVDLDLTNNYLSQIPKDWSHFKHIKSIRLDNNPIRCDCDNVLFYKDMQKRNIEFGDITCDSGKNIKASDCSPLDQMMGDAEGSGDVENEEDRIPAVPLMENEEPQEENVFLPYEDTTTTRKPQETTAPEVIDEQEGSGSSNEELIPHVPATDYDANETANETESEGSGAGVLMPESVDVPEACTENCEKPHPVGAEDEENASPLPGLKDQINILSNDFNIFNEPETTQTEMTTTTTTTTTEEPIVTETTEVMLKEVEASLEKTSDKTNFTLPENTKLGRSSIETSQANTDTVYVIIGVIAVALICLLVFFIKKRGNDKQKKQKPAENFGEEMILMEKSAIQPVNEKPVQSERVPLMNGQNGKINENDFNDVELRPPQANQDLLTPKRERVTIKETEIPDSIPKTPLLVHREKNSEGEIVLTPVDNN